MGFDDDLFYNPAYDFDGDGEFDAVEFSAAMRRLQEATAPEEKGYDKEYGNEEEFDFDYDSDLFSEDFSELDSDCFPEENYCFKDEYDIDEDDFLDPRQRLREIGYSDQDLDEIGFELMSESEQEEFAFQAEADFFDCGDIESEASSEVSIPLTISLTFGDFNKIDDSQKNNYPNKRTYNAACRLSELKAGSTFLCEDNTVESEISKCEFILNSDKIAAKYLTVFSGFLLVQAAKENFDLPCDMPDEDEEPKNDFYELFMEVAERDVKLAVDVWVWCVKEFGPYVEYMGNESFAIFCFIPLWPNKYPDEFYDLATNKLSEDSDFRRILISECKEEPFCNVGMYIVHSLELGDIEAAKKIYDAIIKNPKARTKELESIIDRTINLCAYSNNYEVVAAFYEHIFPLIKNTDDIRIQRLLPDIESEILESMRWNMARYEKYEWRKNYKSTENDGLIPEDFETEIDFKAALLKVRKSETNNSTDKKDYVKNNINVSKGIAETEICSDSCTDKLPCIETNESTLEAKAEDDIQTALTCENTTEAVKSNADNNACQRTKSKPEKSEPMGCMGWLIIITPILLIVNFIVFPLFEFAVDAYNKQSVEKQKDAYVAELVDMCEEFGLSDISVLDELRSLDGEKYYYIVISAEGDFNTADEDFYHFVRGLLNKHFFPDFTFNGKKDFSYVAIVSFCFNGDTYSRSGNVIEKNGTHYYGPYQPSTQARENIPYVGMDIDDIHITNLGQAKFRGYSYDVIDNKSCTISHYDYYDSSGLVIFSICCMNGEVTRVFDDRDSPHRPYSNSFGGSYNANDYAHPDDFYEDHYDDFYDYEEAEEYYYEYAD